MEDLQAKMEMQEDNSPRGGLNIFNNELINPSETGPAGSGDAGSDHNDTMP